MAPSSTACIVSQALGILNPSALGSGSWETSSEMRLALSEWIAMCELFFSDVVSSSGGFKEPSSTACIVSQALGILNPSALGSSFWKVPL